MKSRAWLRSALQLLQRAGAAEPLSRGVSNEGFKLTGAAACSWHTEIPFLGFHSVRSYRREPISQAQVQAEMEEEAKNIDLAPHKILNKGDPGTQQTIIKDVIPLGYFVTMPNGKEAYLSAQDLGFTGGLAILERLFKVGQEITVRVASIGGGGREILSIKKPEHAPPERKFTVSTSSNRGHGSRY
ncbi:hypothetical protein GOP47_0026121 [Adiantum capillus-veneris]|uniref:S1 motif domain-containing protein n=1 Tax=Adiantum capillus-veneris TaxID=13818 RepID=A0A9D4U273_ADICA|nr:hypothetical protein GOP47_0026121 [Adiantum capillus-veneris]